MNSKAAQRFGKTMTIVESLRFPQSFNMSCCAVIETNGKKGRCPNRPLNGKYHCGLHHHKAQKMYSYYKKVCANVDNYDINAIDDVNQLMKIYSYYNQAYDARMKHRSYAFVEEMHDEGHNEQFNIIRQKIDDCERRLTLLYQRSLCQNDGACPRRQSRSRKTAERLELERSVEEAINRIEKTKSERSLLNKTNVDYLDKCISENKALLKAKREVFHYISKKLKEMTRHKYDTERSHVFVLAVFRLIQRLFELGYFNDDFDITNYKPSRAEEEDARISFLFPSFWNSDSNVPKGKGSASSYMMGCELRVLNLYSDMLDSMEDRLKIPISSLKEFYDDWDSRIFIMELMFIFVADPDTEPEPPTISLAWDHRTLLSVIPDDKLVMMSEHITYDKSGNGDNLECRIKIKPSLV